METLRYIRYRILRSYNKITGMRIFMSKERKLERKKNADILFEKIMKEKISKNN